MMSCPLIQIYQGGKHVLMSMDLLNVNKSRYLSSFPRVLHISCRQFVSWLLWLWSLCCAREETLLSRSLQTTEPRNTEEPSTWQIRAWWKFKRFQIFEQNLKLSKLRLLPHFMIRRTRKIGELNKIFVSCIQMYYVSNYFWSLCFIFGSRV